MIIRWTDGGWEVHGIDDLRVAFEALLSAFLQVGQIRVCACEELLGSVVDEDENEDVVVVDFDGESSSVANMTVVRDLRVSGFGALGPLPLHGQIVSMR